MTDAQMKAIESSVNQLVKDTDQFVRDSSVLGINNYQSNLNVLLQTPIFQGIASGFDLGQEHSILAVKALVPNIEITFDPTKLVNSTLNQVSLNNTIRLAGNFSNSIITSVKSEITKRIIPNSDGEVLTKKQLDENISTILNVSRNRANMISRTETTSIYNNARLFSYFRIPQVEAVIFIAILDNSTTLICRSRNGLIIPLRDVHLGDNVPPLHVRCRSVLSPIMPSVLPGHKKMYDNTNRRLQAMEIEPLPLGWNTKLLV